MRRSPALHYQQTAISLYGCVIASNIGGSSNGSDVRIDLTDSFPSEASLQASIIDCSCVGTGALLAGGLVDVLGVERDHFSVLGAHGGALDLDGAVLSGHDDWLAHGDGKESKDGDCVLHFD